MNCVSSLQSCSRIRSSGSANDAFEWTTNLQQDSQGREIWRPFFTHDVLCGSTTRATAAVTSAVAAAAAAAAMPTPAAPTLSQQARDLTIQVAFRIEGDILLTIYSISIGTKACVEARGCGACMIVEVSFQDLKRVTCPCRISGRGSSYVLVGFAQTRFSEA